MRVKLETCYRKKLHTLEKDFSFVRLVDGLSPRYAPVACDARFSRLGRMTLPG